jgi:4'-phosphopantetheinyl transferase
VTESSASASSVSDTPSQRAAGELGEAGLHLWLCRRDQVANSDTFKRSVLSRYAQVAPADWQFAVSEHGKPHVTGATAAPQFNLSHSRDWLACAVASCAPLGVDLEYCDARREVMKLARRFFCPEEVSALEACQAAVQRDCFYDLWTLKEAAVKARGEALPPGLQRRSFQVSYPGDSALSPGCIAVTAAEIPEDAYYFLLDPLPGYRVAICSLAQSPSPPLLSIYEVRDNGAIMESRVSLRASSRQE